MTEIKTRQIKVVNGNGTGSVKIYPTASKRLHGMPLTLTWASGVSTSGDTLAEQLAAITEIRILVGTRVVRRLTQTTINGTVISAGQMLRDYMLLNGTTYDFDAVSTYVAQIYIPFAEEWFWAGVADTLAWNPALLGGPISVEIDIAALNTSYYPTITAFERVSDDLDAPSSGIITWETLIAPASSTAFWVETNVLKAKGRLVQLSVYPDTENAREITPVTLYAGPNDEPLWDGLTSAQNDDVIGRAGLTPAASGRTANIYDLVAVRQDALAHAFNLEAWGTCKLKIEAASAMGGTCSIIVARLEPR